jgi:hypothetical protein
MVEIELHSGQIWQAPYPQCWELMLLYRVGVDNGKHWALVAFSGGCPIIHTDEKGKEFFTKAEIQNKFISDGWSLKEDRFVAIVDNELYRQALIGMRAETKQDIGALGMQLEKIAEGRWQVLDCTQLEKGWQEISQDTLVARIKKRLGI